jgi:hypothetical protein
LSGINFSSPRRLQKSQRRYRALLFIDGFILPPKDNKFSGGKQEEF